MQTRREELLDRQYGARRRADAAMRALERRLGVPPLIDRGAPAGLQPYTDEQMEAYFDALLAALGPADEGSEQR